MTPISEKKAIYIILCCACITISFNVAAIAAALPSISRDMSLSELGVSKIISYYLIFYGFGALIYAPMTKWISYKWIIVLSMTVYAVSSLYCGAITNIKGLYFGRILSGISGASAIPLGLMLIGKIFPRQERGRRVGLFFTCSFFASLLGLSVSGFASWRWLFIIPGFLGAITSLGMALIKTNLVQDRFEGTVDYFEVFKNQYIRHLFIFIFIISMFYHGVHKWFGVFLSKVYLMDQLGISLFFIIMAVCGAMGQMIGGLLSDKKGRSVSWISGVALLGLATMLLSVRFPLYMLAFILGLVSIGWTIGHNGVSTLLTDLPDKYRQEMASLNSSVRFVSGGIGFYISSFFVKRSFMLTFLVIGIFILLSIFYIIKINKLKTNF